MTDPEIRAILRPTLPHGAVIDEVEIRSGPMRGAPTFDEILSIQGDHGAVRADVVLVGDLLHGYEIKSAADSRARLPRQVAAYSRVFDLCWLVTEPKHLRAALALLPAWWGVLVAEDTALRQHRLATRNASIDPVALLQMMWKDEAVALFREHGIRFPKRVGVRDIWQRATALPLDALRARARTALVNRRGNSAT